MQGSFYNTIKVKHVQGLLKKKLYVFHRHREDLAPHGNKEQDCEEMEK